MAVTEFKNLRAVAKYLQKEGWQVTERTVYNHGKRGLITPNKETGLYDGNSLKRYTVFLKDRKTKEKISVSKLQEDRLKAQTRRENALASKAELELVVAQEKLVPRDDLDMEFASRGAVLVNSQRYVVQTSAAEWIELVEGNPKKRGDLIRNMNEKFDRMLNEFASIKEFHVLFEKTE